MRLYRFMAERPLPFMVIVPIILIVLTAVGWSRDDIIEDEVAEIWIPKNGDFAKDKQYADEVGKNSAAATLFAAMALSRDGGNLFTAPRLEEIRSRMEKAEATTIEYKGETYTWDDVCSGNNAGLDTTYRFPCVRLSPMDLFQEARWFFDSDDRVTWYSDVIRSLLVKPLVPRFGVMSSSCMTAGGIQSVGDYCDEVFMLRTNATFAAEKGYGADFANPVFLFSDINNLELNHPCKMCIEQSYEQTIQRLILAITGVFNVMAIELQKFLLQGNGGGTNNGTDPDPDGTVAAILETVQTILQGLNGQQVRDFYFYYVTRELYATLGMQEYLTSYQLFMEGFLPACALARGSTDLCPTSVTPEEARQHLLNHADSAFSSANIAGAPFPFWNEDGSAMFAGTSPLGGSGIDMSGILLSSIRYFDAENYLKPDDWNPLYKGVVDPTSQLFLDYVLSDPVYQWFSAGVTTMTAHCGNENLPGTKGFASLDALTAMGLEQLSQRWCTEYNVPYMEDGERTRQHFARMFYDLLIDSNSFLGIRQGESDPYVWTIGQACGYGLGGHRDPYTNQSDDSILYNASRELYYIDEGSTLGVLDRNFLIGGADPPVGEYSFDNPLRAVSTIQSFYLAINPEDIVDRVRNCNRPGKALDITISDAEEILKSFKEEFEERWADGWDDDEAGEVKFVGFFDDVGVVGTTGRMLTEITLSNGPLMALSIMIIAVFSAVFLFSFDVIESRVFITVVGVALVLLSFFAALGLGILLGIKVNVSIAWTLPFIILGIGVDDMYIILMALKKRSDYTAQGFVASMKEIIIPVTMTSLCNASMFAVMNIVDIPAVFLTAQMAMISIIFLAMTKIFCYPAYCWWDIQRQAAGRYDVVCCLKKNKDDEKPEEEAGQKKPHFIQTMIYERFYSPLVLKEGPIRRLMHIIIWLGAMALLGVAIYGTTKRSVGLGLEDFFPEDHQAHLWATTRTTELAAWASTISWGELSYKEPTTQMNIIRQYEGVLSTSHVADGDTKALWIADFNIWTTRQCEDNFNRKDADVLVCGRDQVFLHDDVADNGTTCSGHWTRNVGLREKIFAPPDTCLPYEGGVCRPTAQMHPADLWDMDINPVNPGNQSESSWCPVFSGWSDEKFAFCLRQWRNLTSGGGNLILESNDKFPTENPTCSGEFYNDEPIEVPLRFSQGPPLYGIHLSTHEDTLEMIEDTRAICDDDEETHCWLTGIPYNYWEQYLWVEEVLLQVGAAAILVGFFVAFVFLLGKFLHEGNHAAGTVFCGSAIGALLIGLTTLLSLVVVVGLSALADVNLTAFSDMSFVLSVGFSVEYSVHIVHRFLKAPLEYDTPIRRVEHAMSFLTLPTFMSFVSSTIGVVCLAFTKFRFNTIYFFRPLIIVMFVTYFFGCWFLPVLLSALDLEILRLGKDGYGKAVVTDPDDKQADEGPPSEEAQETTAARSSNAEQLNTNMDQDISDNSC